MKPIYLDYNATTPVDTEVAAAMLPYLEKHFGNPSSTHWYGIQTKTAVEQAREQVASLLGCHTDEVVFTSGGSESNNHAIQGIAYNLRSKGNHIITSTIEHPAVMEVCQHLSKVGFEISYVPVDRYGMIRTEDLLKCITSGTILITVMHANNEVGTIQPINEIARIAKQHQLSLHSDAAQSVGKIPVLVNDLGVDLLSVAGHKLYAPKGIGALYVRRGTALTRLIHGANQERGLRAGTENVLQIVGLGKACEIAKRDMEPNAKHMRDMRDRMYNGLLRTYPELLRNGHPEQCLPNTLSVSFPHIESDRFLSEVKGLAASAGAACHSDTIEISPVLKAMGVKPDQAMGTIRFSTGRKTTSDDIDNAIQMITQTVQQLQVHSRNA